MLLNFELHPLKILRIWWMLLDSIEKILQIKKQTHYSMIDESSSINLH